MIEMKYYRDNEYVYIDNPDGTSKRVSIADFESAISGCILTVHVIDEDSGKRFDKTWKEIHDAFHNCKFVIVVSISKSEVIPSYISLMGIDSNADNPYYCSILTYDGELYENIARCPTENDYPIMQTS